MNKKPKEKKKKKNDVCYEADNEIKLSHIDLFTNLEKREPDLLEERLKVSPINLKSGSITVTVTQFHFICNIEKISCKKTLLTHFFI